VFTSFESLHVRTPSPRTSDARLTQDALVAPAKVPELESQQAPEGELETAESEGVDVHKLDTVRDVEFDELGQTWDVYGAELDPEMLGEAIQTHLERIMKDRRRDSVTLAPIMDCRHLGSNDTLDSLSETSIRKAATSLCFFHYLCTSV